MGRKRNDWSGRKCLICGNPLEYPNTKYCSDECAKVAAKENKKRLKTKLRKESKRFCLICCAPIPAESYRQKYCSDECAQAGYRKHASINSRYYRSQSVRFCAACGKQIEFGANRKRYCSDECARQTRIAARALEKNASDAWNPAKETYREYQDRTHILPETGKTIRESVRIAPGR